MWCLFFIFFLYYIIKFNYKNIINFLINFHGITGQVDLIDKLNNDTNKKKIICFFDHTSYYDGYYVIIFILSKSGELPKMTLFVKDSMKLFFDYMPLLKYILHNSLIINYINRDKKNNTVNIISNRLNKKNDENIYLISPDGTTKLNTKWKTGLWYIAKNTEAEIHIITLCYKQKKILIKGPYYASNNIENDFKKFQNVYKKEEYYPKNIDQSYPYNYVFG